MTVNLDTEIASTQYDPVTRMNIYTLERSGRRWTVRVHSDDLNRHGPNKLARRNHLANVLSGAMNGPADGE